MTVDDLKTYLVANVNPYIAARSTTLVPLAALTADQIYTRNYMLPAKGCTVFLDPQDEVAEPMTMGSFLYRQPVDVMVFTQGATEDQLRLRAAGYMAAVMDCLVKHPDFMGVEARVSYDGVEGKEDIKAAKTTVIFESEEAV
jgi:hypothetical protein